MNTIINICRTFGSGGGHIGHAIGEALGIPFYDSELISKAAEEQGYCAALMKQKREKGSFFSMAGFFPSSRIGYMDSGYVNENALFQIQSDVIRGIAAKGDAIFIGRCADYILRDLPCLNVFITAPEAWRIARLAETEGLTPEEAEKLMHRKDHTRETYYNYYTFNDWGKAGNYHLCLDSSLLGIEGSAEAIIEFGRLAGRIR